MTSPDDVSRLDHLLVRQSIHGLHVRNAVLSQLCVSFYHLSENHVYTSTDYTT